MTNDDIEIFIMLVTRTDMMVYPNNSDCITNFVQGYEAGTKKTCNFTILSKQLLSEKYKIQYSSDGWPGQINRLAQKNSQSWTFTFKQITQEIISSECNGVLPENFKDLLTSRVRGLIDQIKPPLYDSWTEKWLDLASADNYFPNQMWSTEELEVINLISNEIKNKNIYADSEKKTPSTKLVDLMTRFQSTNIKNGT